MKVPLSWLRDFVDIDLPPDDLAHVLTMAGLEVGEIERLGSDWDGIFVGAVTSLEKHPNADRLLLARVGNGEREFLAVTGAPNLEVGQRVPVALPGARILDAHSTPARHATVKPATLRGVQSEAVVCSERELGLSDDHTGIMILDPLAPVGAPLAEVLGDTVFDLELTPNLARALSIVGVAREVAALTGKELRVPALPYDDVGPSVTEAIEIVVEDPALCPRYTASLVRGLEVRPSPAWMQRRLRTAGMRPINNIVDITNYVMLEWGQPLHAFDYDRIVEKTIIVRTARPGEGIVTLDGVQRQLAPSMLLIADPQQGTGIAGVMGGQVSEVTETTRNVLIEAANFNQTNIRRTSQALKLRSEASYRFERGIDPELTVPALKRSAELMKDLGGGTIARGMADLYPVKATPRMIPLTADEVERILGLRLTLAQIADMLTRLGFGVEMPGASVRSPRGSQARSPLLRVTVPTFRRDVTVAADLIEELARMVGYDNLPMTLLSDELPEQRMNWPWRRTQQVREVMVAAGLQEIISYSLTNLGLLANLEAAAQSEVPGPYSDPRRLLKVMNVLSTEHEYLRPTLLGSLLETIARNLRHADQVGLFEVGNVYLSRGEDELPEERRLLAAGMTGLRRQRTWAEAPESVDFFNMKGAVEALLGHFALRDVRFEATHHPVLHPGRSARILVAGEDLGVVGEVHPRVVAAFDLPPQRVVLAEIDLERLFSLVEPFRRYQPLSRFPAVVQDLAVVLPLPVPAADVEHTIRRAGGALVADVRLFDLYVGPQVPEGRKSLAYSITYQAEDRTLTDEDAAVVHARIVRRLEQDLGAALRG